MKFYGNGWEAEIDAMYGVTIEFYGEEPMYFYNQKTLISAKAIIKSYCPDYSILRAEA